MTIGRRMLALLLAVLAAGWLVGCGGKSSSTASGGQSPAVVAPNLGDNDTEDIAPCPTAGNERAFAKTRFAVHAGLALGAFHRYIYKPLRNGGFRAGADKRARTFAKAAVAGAFVAHELKVAKGFAEANPTLCNSVQGLSDRLAALTGKLRNGTATEVDLNSDQRGFVKLQTESRGQGYDFTERETTVPGAG